MSVVSEGIASIVPQLDEAALRKTTDNAARSIGKSFSTAGKGLSASITAPIVGIGTAAIAAATDAQKAMATIRAGTGATGAALDGMLESAQQIAGQVPQSLDEVATVVADLDTLTDQTGEGLEELADKVLQLAQITGEASGDITRSSARMFERFNVGVEDQAGSLELLFQISQDTGVAVADLAEQASKNAETLKVLGLDAGQSADLVGQLERAGFNATQTLTGMSRGLGRAVASSDEFNTQAEALDDAIRRIIEADLPDEAFAIGRELVGSTNAGREFAAAVRDGSLSFDDLRSSADLTRDSVSEAFWNSLTPAQQLQMMFQELQTALVPLGETLLDAFQTALPHIQTLVGLIERGVNWFDGLSDSTQTFILAAAGIAAAVGPALLVLGRLATMWTTIRSNALMAAAAQRQAASAAAGAGAAGATGVVAGGRGGRGGGQPRGRGVRVPRAPGAIGLALGAGALVHHLASNRGDQPAPEPAPEEQGGSLLGAIGSGAGQGAWMGAIGGVKGMAAGAAIGGAVGAFRHVRGMASGGTVHPDGRIVRLAEGGQREHVLSDDQLARTIAAHSSDGDVAAAIDRLAAELAAGRNGQGTVEIHTAVSAAEVERVLDRLGFDNRAATTAGRRP